MESKEITTLDEQMIVRDGGLEALALLESYQIKIAEMEARNLKLEQQRDTFLNELVRKINKADQREVEFNAQKGIIEKHLCNMLNEHREIFTNTKEFASYEFAVDYIEACKAVTQLGHEGYSTNEVQNWVNEKYMSDPLNF